jgi:ubiquinone biosynthesis protein Coq4
MDNFAYLTSSVRKGATTSSVLSSTSRFLNNPVLRDWVATHYLRRNGPDRPPSSDTASGLIPALLEMTDVARVERLVEAERQINPRFAAWTDEAFVGHHTLEFFAGFPAGSLGGIYHHYLVSRGLQPNLARAMIQPKSPYEFIRFRFGQLHDFEHLLSGGGFDTLGEILPFFMRQANVCRHLSPELAGELTPLYILGGFRMPVRAGLHYPQIYLTVLDLVQRGIRIGLDSEPIFMSRFEDVLHLTPPAAREALGVRGAEDIDTVEASAIFDDVAVEPALTS